jgi:hypothetical protein
MMNTNTTKRLISIFLFFDFILMLPDIPVNLTPQ